MKRFAIFAILALSACSKSSSSPVVSQDPLQPGPPNGRLVNVVEDLEGTWVATNNGSHIWITGTNQFVGTYWFISYSGQHTGSVGVASVTGNVVMSPYSPTNPGATWELDPDWRYDSVTGEEILVLTHPSGREWLREEIK